MRLSRKLLYGPDTIKSELLSTRICDLKVKLNGNILGRAVQRAMAEVRRFKITLEPLFYLSDSYGCVENTINIGLGFWDCNDHLREIFRDAVGYIRDETDLLLLIKHEIGHAFGYAHGLFRLAEFRKVFSIHGNFFATYPHHDHYRYDPFSVDFVNPDYDHYAQKHPDDDFAETFATAIDVNKSWQDRYRGRPGALKKINYVLRLIRDYGSRSTKMVGGEGLIEDPLDKIRQTVAQNFKVSKKRYLLNAQGYVDDELQGIFRRPDRLQRPFSPATTLLRKHRKFIEHTVRERVRPRDPRVISDVLEKIRLRLNTLELVYLDEEGDRMLAELYGMILHKTVLFTRFGIFRIT